MLTYYISSKYSKYTLRYSDEYLYINIDNIDDADDISYILLKVLSIDINNISITYLTNNTNNTNINNTNNICVEYDVTYYGKIRSCISITQ